MLSTTGRHVLGAAVCLAAVALYTGYPQLLALAAGCGAIILFAYFTAPTPRLSVRPLESTTRAVDGIPALVPLVALNASGRSSAPTRVIALLTGTDRPVLHIKVLVPVLRAGGSSPVSLSVPALPRGVYRVTSLITECEGELGLFGRRREVPCDLRLTVHPRTTNLPVPRRTGTTDEADRTRGPLLPGALFHALRDYQPGDDVRLIHWMATARTGRPVVRDLVQSEVLRRTIILDTSAGTYASGSFETAVQIAGSLALAPADETWLLTTDGLHRRYGSSGSRESVLDALAQVRCGGRRGTAPRLPAESTTVTVITGPSANENHWRALAGRRELQIVTVAEGIVRRPTRGLRVLAVPTLDELSPRLSALGRR